MVNDFISLSCPSCGGKLLISPNTNTAICDYCKTEHLVRREAGTVGLESFAACPICHRNDKSQKISTLPGKFQPPKKPIAPTEGGGCSIWIGTMLILGSIAGIGALISALYTELGYPRGGNWIPCIIGMVICVLTIIWGTKISDLGLREREEFDSNLDFYNKQGIPEWESLLAKWKKLYYCQRDDVVYDIETRIFCDPKEIETKLLSL